MIKYASLKFWWQGQSTSLNFHCSSLKIGFYKNIQKLNTDTLDTLYNQALALILFRKGIKLNSELVFFVFFFIHTFIPLSIFYYLRYGIQKIASVQWIVEFEHNSFLEPLQQNNTANRGLSGYTMLLNLPQNPFSDCTTYHSGKPTF